MSKCNLWTPEEDELLRAHLASDGSKIVQRLPGRTYAACLMRARKLGFATPSRVDLWTSQEDQVIRDFFPSEGSAVSARLPGRTSTACSLRAHLLGVHSRMWSKEEDMILRLYLASEGKLVVQRLPGRTYAACIARARARAYSLPLPASAWTEREDSILKAFYPLEGNSAFRRLPDRTQAACVARVSFLGLRARTDYWTQEEKDLLIELHNRGESVEGHFPGRSAQAVSEMRKRLGLKAGARRWSKEDVTYMKRYYSKLGPNRVAEKLGRSYSSVTSMAARLGLEQATYSRVQRSSGMDWSEEEDAVLRMSISKPVSAVAQLLSGRSDLEIETRRRELGLTRSLASVWSDEEDELLRKWYPVMGSRVAEKLNGRTVSACVQRAFVLGIQSVGK